MGERILGVVSAAGACAGAVGTPGLILLIALRTALPWAAVPPVAAGVL